MMDFIRSEIAKTQSVIEAVLHDEALLRDVEKVARECISSLRKGGKILFAGNGGSAADSQHLAAELVSKLQFDRPALAAMALTVDTSALTAIGNDYAFEHLFSRQIEALGKEGDVLIGISTSGNSPNILKALEVARAQKLTVIGMSGASGGKMKDLCDVMLRIPSSETPKIQEAHIMLGHIFCAIVEEEMFKRWIRE